MNQMIVVENQEPVVSTEVLAEGFGVIHKAVLQMVRKYQNHFEEMGKVEFQIRPSAKNQTIKFLKLNELQSAFLGTLLKNTPEVIGFKKKLTLEFFRIRTALARELTKRQNSEWLEKRASGKLTRRQETDTIKKFVDYAKSQGSQSAEKYYMNISKMQNQSLFLLEQKYPNLRDVLSLNQLSTIESADRIVSRALVEGMEKLMPYKDIYQLAKKRVEMFSEIHGKTPVPAMLEGPRTKQLEMAA